jgi:hypothetical protein
LLASYLLDAMLEGVYGLGGGGVKMAEILSASSEKSVGPAPQHGSSQELSCRRPTSGTPVAVSLLLASLDLEMALRAWAVRKSTSWCPG